MKHLLSIILTGILFTGAFANGKPRYKITGTVTGLPENTWLYLRTATPDKDIDSCRVINGMFTMSGTVAEKATQVYLHTAMYKNYVSFWLENTNITINVKAGEFKKGTITGSVTNDEDKKFAKLQQPLTKQADSLEHVLETTIDKPARKILRTQITELDQKIKQAERNYIRSHPNSLIAADLLNIYASKWGRDTTAALYHHMNAEMKATRYGRETSDFIALNKDISVGKRFADFEQLNTGGKLIKLSGLKSRYILLDFWASWCGPCREESPNLVKTYQQFKDKGFTVLGVSLDDKKSNWLKAVIDDKLTWENVCDLRGDKNRAALIYGISGIPYNFLINDKGIIIAKSLRGKELDDKLKELLP